MFLNIHLHTCWFLKYLREWTQKFPELLQKIYLKYLYKLESLVPFQVPPLVTGCSDTSAAPTAGNIVQYLQRKCCQGLSAIWVQNSRKERGRMSRLWDTTTILFGQKLLDTQGCMAGSIVMVQEPIPTLCHFSGLFHHRLSCNHFTSFKKNY